MPAHPVDVCVCQIANNLPRDVAIGGDCELCHLIETIGSSVGLRDGDWQASLSEGDWADETVLREGEWDEVIDKILFPHHQLFEREAGAEVLLVLTLLSDTEALAIHFRAWIHIRHGHEIVSGGEICYHFGVFYIRRSDDVGVVRSAGVDPRGHDVRGVQAVRKHVF